MKVFQLLYLLLGLKIMLFWYTQSLASYSFKIAYAVWKGEEGGTHIFIMDSDGSNTKQLTPSLSVNGNPSWAPDGKIVFDTNRDGNWEIYAVSPDGSEFFNLTNTPNFDERAAAVSPDGNRIAFSSQGFIYIMDADGGNRKRLSNENIFLAQDWGPRWSPDGAKIAFTSHRDGNYEIYVMDVDGNNQINLTNNPSADRSPCFSADGSEILFVSDRGKPVWTFDIFSLSSKTKKVKLVVSSPSSNIDPCFSSDSSMIAFASDREGQLDIYTMDMSSKRVTRLTSSQWDERYPSISPPQIKGVTMEGSLPTTWGKIKRKYLNFEPFLFAPYDFR